MKNIPLQLYIIENFILQRGGGDNKRLMCVCDVELLYIYIYIQNKLDLLLGMCISNDVCFI